MKFDLDWGIFFQEIPGGGDRYIDLLISGLWWTLGVSASVATGPRVARANTRVTGRKKCGTGSRTASAWPSMSAWNPDSAPGC